MKAAIRASEQSVKECKAASSAGKEDKEEAGHMSYKGKNEDDTRKTTPKNANECKAASSAGEKNEEEAGHMSFKGKNKDDTEKKTPKEQDKAGLAIIPTKGHHGEQRLSTGSFPAKAKFTIWFGDTYSIPALLRSLALKVR